MCAQPGLRRIPYLCLLNSSFCTEVTFNDREGKSFLCGCTCWYHALFRKYMSPRALENHSVWAGKSAHTLLLARTRKSEHVFYMKFADRSKFWREDTQTENFQSDTSWQLWPLRRTLSFLKRMKVFQNTNAVNLPSVILTVITLASRGRDSPPGCWFFSVSEW